MSALERLFPFTPRTTVLSILLGVIASFFAFGFFYPYWRVADMDMMLTYNAWLLNEGLPQEHFDHPGYLTIALLSLWFKGLHGIGVLEAYKLAALPPAAELLAYEHAWTTAVRAARLASLALSLLFVVGFYALLRRLIDDGRVAAVGAFALAFSGGLAMHARIVRTELLSAALVTLALLIILFAASRPHLRMRLLLLALASLLATLAVENKVQALLLLCALPIIVLPFGSRDQDPKSFWRSDKRRVMACLGITAAAALLAFLAAPVFAVALSPDALGTAELHPLAGPAVMYQIAIALWIAVGVLVFAIVWRVSPMETLAVGAAIIGGCALGLLVLRLYDFPRDIIVTLNPFHAMFEYASASHPDLHGARALVSENMLRHLFDGFLATLARLTFVLQPSPRPTIFIAWVAIAGTILAWRKGERRLALQALTLLAAAFAVDTISMLRGLKIEYFIYTDPLVIIALALLLVRVPELTRWRWSYAIGLALISAHIVISQAEPVKHAFKRSGPEGACEIPSYYFKRLEPFPFCKQA
jgi:hypothetical protein